MITVQFEQGTEERTQKILAKMKGHQDEFSRLQGILVIAQDLPVQDRIALGQVFSFGAIAERLDEINAEALERLKS